MFTTPQTSTLILLHSTKPLQKHLLTPFFWALKLHQSMATDRDYYYSSSSHSHPPLPIHLCFFLVILFMFISFSWYLNYESFFEGLFDQVKMVFILSPLLLLLVVHFFPNFDTRRSSNDALYRAGETPWGVGCFLVILLFMLSYQSDFRERWFPLLSRWSCMVQSQKVEYIYFV